MDHATYAAIITAIVDRLTGDDAHYATSYAVMLVVQVNETCGRYGVKIPTLGITQRTAASALRDLATAIKAEMLVERGYSRELPAPERYAMVREVSREVDALAKSSDFNEHPLILVSRLK